MSLISKMFGDEILYDPFLSMVKKCPVLNTPTDWKETPEAHLFTADLPGLRKEDVKVEVVEEAGSRLLQISGDRNNNMEKEDGDQNHEKWHRVERCHGKFLRRFRLPENANTDQVKASMENGVLVVTIPKQQVKKPEKKVIEIEQVKA
ncbi:hypothetical protein Dsin_030989 [Dipteronia sinensis]|uniref:SHSP domain-containing protein n=1 Tax=Dipteronia sinensis TaxID=43782 RepID=A0AAD9ZL36_9ROSI|nr:hypothetical protein Dsin_030989 [Dipteronia sinensis]